QNARLLAAGETRDRAVELIGVEEESLRPSRDVDRAIAKDHVIAVRAQPFAQRPRPIELLAGLVEVDDAQPGGALHVPRVRRAFDLPVRALGPRRSHSTSRRTRLASDSCRLDCASRNSSFFSRNLLYPPSTRKMPSG